MEQQISKGEGVPSIEEMRKANKAKKLCRIADPDCEACE